MNFEEFLDKIFSNGILYEEEGAEYDHCYYPPKKVKAGRPILMVKWETGGMSGGNCWDNSDPRPYKTNEKEPDFTILDDILALFCPDMNFLTYKTLVGKVVEYDEYTEHEYYGNSVDYSYKRVDLEQLYKELQGVSLL